mmetsp:Transcript_31770/g.73755  ORF Transcript_31770/g.73755 Transcript_31770/m.73755 type:complete len:469 (+) Transcript_31770:62-1468(+)|eukprot:CAMPEP_0171106056 /NCGR_PEP_ID=MMETSP0766_2-20121228/63963_1 /TAXON_ID=439317 /ORGANISM="Gambierdiscus australes, Strain CAWD 149" /LENGTH=468 /DNA_ID=CAMNT_0011567053 /DNA_START=61 /DNA_END=1467 /DNA_ORIENTATION=-
MTHQEPLPPEHAKPCEGKKRAYSLTVCIVARRLWFFFVIVTLAVSMFTIIGPIYPYIVLSFFAKDHGGSDCISMPKSEPCRLAAADVTSYNSVVGSLTSAVSVFSALTLGSVSDSIGRRAIFITKGLLTTSALGALALYQLAGVNLWIFLVLKPVSAMWDFNGVFLALVADMIPEKEMRVVAVSTLLALTLAMALVSLALGALLPITVCFALALTAGAVKLFFYFAFFPETLAAPTSQAMRQRQGPVGALRAALQVLTANAFIFRMACTAAIGSVSTMGTGLVAQAYLTAYIGMRRQELAELSVVMGASVVVTVTGLARPLVECFGDVRTYQLSLIGVAVLPAGFCLCSEPWHVMLLCGLFTGPMILQFPTVTAIKSNLVGDAEQGLMQGALASLLNAASAAAALGFGWMYSVCTEGGTVASRQSAFLPLLVASLIGAASFLVSLSLPKQVPPPVSLSAPDDLSTTLL